MCLASYKAKKVYMVQHSYGTVENIKCELSEKLADMWNVNDSYHSNTPQPILLSKEHLHELGFCRTIRSRGGRTTI